MRKSLVALSAICLFVSSCNNETKKSTKKYGDYFAGSLKGNIRSIQDSIFVVDSLGNIRPDSLQYGLGEYKDGYLIHYTDIDTLGKKTFSTYNHFDNGLLKGVESVMNGKTVYRLEAQLDSAGRYTSAQSYDSTGKMDYYNKDLTMNELGLLVNGKLYKANDSLVNSFTAEYDSNVYKGGNEYDGAGRQTSNRTVTLNDRRDPVEDAKTTFTKDSSTTKRTTYSYEYDATGNWTRQTVMDEKGRPTKITKRKITYVN